jgi:hypothetical protein
VGSRESRAFELRSARVQTAGPRWALLFVLLACLWLLAGPRVELLSIANSSVRLEDAILVALTIYSLANWGAAARRRYVRRGALAVAAIGLTCVLISFAFGRVELLPGFLYAIRPLEYWVVYPALVIALGSRSEGSVKLIVRVLAAVTLVQVGVALLQVAGLSIGFSKFSYERGAGLTAGPYELGAMCAMLACFWLARRSYVLALVSIVGVLASQSRVSLVAVVIGVILLILIDHHRGQKIKRPALRPTAVIWSTAVVVGSILVLPLALPTLLAPSVARVDDSQLTTAWDEARGASEPVGKIATADEYAAIAYDAIGVDVLSQTASSDASNVVRFYRWQLLLGELTESPVTMAFGVGPSFAGPSVDGAFLRIVVETGVMGLAVWMVWFRRTLQGAVPWLVAVAATLIVGSLFIDLLFALRPMALFWLLAALGRKENGRTAGV